MKSLYLRSGLALLCAVIVSACGGNGSGDLPLSGTISGLNKNGLVLLNKSNGDKVTVNSGDVSFQFPKLAANDEEFDITIPVETTPAGTKCEVVSGGKAKANVYTYNRIAVTCVADQRKLGGTVTGLIGKGLVLANGADTAPVLVPATPGASASFLFPSTVGDGYQYGVTVLVQPAGQTCAVNPANNPGTMGSADVLNLAVNCSNN
jgi:hypothetical protein